MSSIFPSAFKNQKKILKVLVLGPYKPLKAKKRLFRLRDYLRMHGYENANVVEDFPNIPKYDEDPDIHFTLKSRDKIRNWADVLIFVFMCQAYNLGVWAELDFTIKSVKDKIRLSVVYHEKGTVLSSQTRGPLKIVRMFTKEFPNDPKLFRFAFSFCTNATYEFFL